MLHPFRPRWWGGLYLGAVLLGCGGSGPGADGECEDGHSQCYSLTEIQYCFDGRWVTPETCPPEEVNGFTITTICDEGRCRP